MGKKTKKVASGFSYGIIETFGELKKNKKSGRWLQYERNGKFKKDKNIGKLLWLWGKWKKSKKVASGFSYGVIETWGN